MAQYDLSEIVPHPDTQWVLDKLQEVLAETVSTTIEGNRLTLTWNQRGTLMRAACIILSVDDGKEALLEPMEDPAEQATEP